MQNLPKPIIIFFGPPGAGKGTQSRMIAQKYALMYLGSGDILRETSKENSDDARTMKEYIKKGELVPSDLVGKIFIEKFKEVLIGGLGAVLDGFPRNIEQAEKLDEAIKDFENVFVKIILIDLDEKTAIDRMLKRRICTRCNRSIPYRKETKDLKRCPDCGGELIVRKDDDEDIIRQRFKVYQKETEPLIEYYGDKVVKIDGKPEIEEIFEEIISNFSASF